MSTARKLPSGSWRCQVFSHWEDVLDKNGTPLLDKNGKVKRKRIYKSFTSTDPTSKGKRTAEYKAAQFAREKEDQLRREQEEAEEEILTFGDAFDKYIFLREAVLSPNTVREYKRCRKKDLQELMPLNIYDITQEDIQKIINEETKNHSPKTVRNLHGLISAVFRMYRPNFALNTRLPQKVPAELYIPTDEDIRKLLETIKNTEMEIPVLLAAFGPMRRGEICALESDHISGNTIHVKYAMALDENRNWVIKPPKNVSSDRYIEFPDFVIDKMKDIKGRIIKTMNPGNITYHHRKVLERNGIPHFRFHDLRHYSASIQHALNIPDQYIMARGGWSTDSTLKTVYRHTMSDKAAKMNNLANEHFASLAFTDSVEAVPNEVPTTTESYTVAEGFDHKRLLDLGYFMHLQEGGYLSSNLATIIYRDHPEHGSAIRLFMTERADIHDQNIAILKSLGYIKNS